MTSATTPNTQAFVEALDLPPVTGEALLLGALVLLVGWLLGRLVRWTTRRVLCWRGRSPSASEMFGTLGQTVTVVLSFAAALTLIFPSVEPVNALG